MSGDENNSASDIRSKQKQNLIVLAVVIIILVFGGWLVDRMLTARDLQNCIEARHRNCQQLELPQR